jgi:hypothetical protein
MKKRLLSLVMAVLMVVGIAPMAACSSGVENIVADPTTLNVKIYKAGFGTDYIEAFKTQFEKTFEKEGYKINITAHDPFLMGEAVYRSVYSNTGIDVYFASSTSAKDGMAGKNYQNSFTDITDSVYKKPAIGFDGKEESQTIEEKLKATGRTVENNIYEGKYYGLPYSFTMGGLNVNTKMLYDVFGYTELPRTTKEMFDMADFIMSKYDEEFVAPFTFSLTGNNYLTNAAIPWMAQLMGPDAVYDYYGFMDGDKELRPVWENGELVSGAYEVFGHEAFEEVFAGLYQILDWNTCTANASTQSFDAAQAQFMRGDGVFYFCGDYMFNEEKIRFKDKLNDIDYIRTPMMSKVGLDLFGEGTAYGFDEEKADKTLSIIIKYVDQNLTTAEVETKAEAELGYALETKDVETVCQKRGLFRSDGSAPLVHVSSKIPANKLPVAEAFLRFVASDEAGAMYAMNANTISPWNTGARKNDSNEYIKSVAAFAHNQHNAEINASNNRYKMDVGYYGTFAGMGEVWSVNFYEDYVSKYDEEGKLAFGDEVYEKAGKDKAKWMYDYAYSQIKDKLWQAPGDYPEA